MTYLESTLALIKHHEGLRLRPYTDTVGKLSIGYGRNLTDNGISQAEADLMLESDLVWVLKSLEKYDWFDGLNDNRKMAMIDMMYNLGEHRFSLFKNMLAALGRGDYEKAADEMLSSRWSMQVAGRAVALASIIRKGS